MAHCSFRSSLAPDYAGGEMTSWVSPSSTPPSACLSSTTAARASDTPTAAFRQPQRSPTSVFSGSHQVQMLYQNYLLPLSLQQHHGQHPQQPGPRQVPIAAPSCSELQQQTQLLGLQHQCNGQGKVQALTHNLHVPSLPGSFCFPPFHVAPCQASVAVVRHAAEGHQKDNGQQPSRHQPQQQQWQQQRQQLEQQMLLLVQQHKRQIPQGKMCSLFSGKAVQSLPLKRPRDGDLVTELPMRSYRGGCLALHPSSSLFSRRLQRHNSIDSDDAQSQNEDHSDSSFGFAIAPTVATTATAITAVATANSNVIMPCTGPSAIQSVWKPSQSHQGQIHLGPTVRAWAHGPVVCPLPPASSRPAFCAADGEEFILQATRALGLSLDTCGRLALHIWRRVGGIVRLVLSIRHPHIDRGDPRVAASAYRIHATACLWVASKVEEQRRVVAEARELAALSQTSAEALCAAELRLLAWVEWCPLRGYLPSPQPRPVPGAGSS
ncbi:hypothetical protein Vretimale_3167 [Volvox reticuliferus]|uniref:Uncharacterized protein n=1 Tax=Volvox reticuliferus TaxID=1737510 RepID=A0A8J4D802_9CHLO|nr:hypothetical protein Vretifemale_6577 [Volvox reticuliferus]GIL97520.1 hypothetical protein Vretimale_3167 [Volvox reticuliferus]